MREQPGNWEEQLSHIEDLLQEADMQLGHMNHSIDEPSLFEDNAESFDELRDQFIITRALLQQARKNLVHFGWPD